MSKEQTEIQRINYINQCRNYVRSLEIDLEFINHCIADDNKRIAYHKNSLQLMLQKKKLLDEAMKEGKKQLKEIES